MARFNFATAVAVAAMIFAAPAATDCSLSMLQTSADSLVAAQSAGTPNSISGLSSTVTYTENSQPATISTGILSQPLKIDHNRSTHDTTQCATYTEMIITDPKHPYVIGVQMRFNGTQITKVESLVTDAGDWLFNATGTLRWASVENWGEIPEAQRDSRATIQAAADAYLDLFNNKSVVVPWGTPCDRLEGGSYTGTGSATDSCNVGVPSGIQMTNRRYVIDETVGACDVFLSFGGGTSGLPDSHEFRVQSGKLRYVHTITVCSVANCGL